MDPNTICLGSITFEDPNCEDNPNCATHLQYPKYDDLFRYSIVNDDVRKILQVEPAFQLSSGASGKFTFQMKIADGQQARFARKESGIPYWTECTAGSDVLPAPVKAISIDECCKTCRIEVEPASWNSGPHVVVLRIFCTSKTLSGAALDLPSDFCDLDGVSLTLIRPGGKQVAISANKDPDRSQFTVEVEIQEILGKPCSSFKIFKKSDFPDHVLPEPAFRSSPERSNVHLQLSLQSCSMNSCNYYFIKKLATSEAPYQDEVVLMAHNEDGSRPDRLSAVKISEDQQSINFSWFRGKPVTASVAYGFSGQVGKPVGSSADLFELEELYIDPVIFHDPPLFPVFGGV